MCGISGVISTDPQLVNESLRRAEVVQLHRGPDSQGSEVFNTGNWHVGINHQRLSILDLSDAGNQPMYSHSNRSVIAYNGEVYNYEEINKDKLSLSLQTGTDTEVVLEALEKFGPKDALNYFNGMWAFSWVDLDRNKVVLARDRVGIKPLYYTVNNGSLFFSSEVKGVLESVGGQFSLDKQVVGEYVVQSLQDTSDSTFFEEIKSIPAGHYAEFDLSSKEINLNIIKYWDVTEQNSDLTFDEAKEKFNDLFHDAVKLRMRSDVPVGVTLSGGLDSSSIAICMKSFLKDEQELKILSAVTLGSELDETEFIDIMGEHLKCQVSKVDLQWTAGEAMSLMREVTWKNDSPIGSFSNIAHYKLMEKAKELGITVILSGQGADELLCGYKKYLAFYLQSLLREKRVVRFISTISRFMFNKTILNQFSFQEAKRYLPSFLLKKEIDIKGAALQSFEPVRLGLLNSQDIRSRQVTDLKNYSVPYLTHYEDRMSMAWSREIRLPFLDYRLIELLMSVPTSFKLDKGWTKFILRKAVEPLLPKRIVWRKDKQGFITPQEEWLKHELRDEVEKAFSEDALIFKLNLINRDALLIKYKKFCIQGTQSGGVWYREIFNPFALEVWLQSYRKYIKAND